ncbi:hypothetical protein K502DRAFT_216356 [Neoconidiobolus thromboides FSU 785]|nr:hypothetical protein K502DRAFT_216356 [Neoconidiobolus thromboides FSU 785]
MDTPTLRINSSQINAHINQVVRIVGSVESMNPEFGILEASDRGRVEILLNNNVQVRSKIVEIVGKALPDGKISALACYALPDNFGKI